MFKFIKKIALAGLALVGLVSTQVYAAIPATVTSAISTAQTDGETLGYALLVMAIVVSLVFWLKSKGGR